MMDEDIIKMIREGYDTTPKMVCYLMGIEFTEPKDMTNVQRTEYTRTRQRLSHKMQVLRKWHEIEAIERNSNSPYIWCVVEEQSNEEQQ